MAIFATEYSIEPTTALALIQEQFPLLCAQQIKLISLSWDNSAFLIDGKFIFRFPRREAAVASLRYEMHLLPELGQKSPISVPLPKWQGMPSEEYPFPFSGYATLPGRIASHVSLSSREWMELAGALANFLQLLHSLPLEAARHLPVDLLGRLNAQRLVATIRENIEQMRQLQLLQDEDFEQILAPSLLLLPSKEIKVVHGDFCLRHLLLNEQKRLSGVIDWGECHLGDPAVDLAIVHSFLPTEAQSHFKSIYGEIEESRWLLARLRALYNCTMLALYAFQSCDKPLLRESMRGVAQILQ